MKWYARDWVFWALLLLECIIILMLIILFK